MALTKSQLSLIHVAKKALSLEDDTYRAILRQEAGVTSSRDLDAAGFDAVMARFKRLGFAPAAIATAPTFGVRPGMASPRQVELIRCLWREFKGDQADDSTVGHWLERTFLVSSLRFASYDDAHKAIGALKTMKARKSDKRPGKKHGADVFSRGAGHAIEKTKPGQTAAHP